MIDKVLIAWAGAKPDAELFCGARAERRKKQRRDAGGSHNLPLYGTGVPRHSIRASRKRHRKANLDARVRAPGVEVFLAISLFGGYHRGRFGEVGNIVDVTALRFY